MKYNKEELESLTLSLAAILGKFPSKKDIDSFDLMPSYNTCIRNGLSLQELYPKYNENKYNISPKICPTCSDTIPFDKRVNTFCGSSCSATYNNLAKFALRPDYQCLHCAKDISRSKTPSKSIYCSTACQMGFKKETDKLLWLDGGMPQASNRRLRGFLTDLLGYECSICGISEWDGKPITLEVEHKSGDSEDNSKENVCLICPNCHSQTPTYKGRNKGNGRHARRQRYAEGKSY